MMDPEFSDAQLLRYSRQIMLPGFDIAGQQKLAKSRVLVVGLGGLGCPVAMYLAAAGVGTLVLADFDKIELSNLQRQIAHFQQDMGRLKVDSVADKVRQLNTEVEVVTESLPLQDELLRQTVARVDVVVDASDNFATRFAINQACVEQCKPLISGAAIRMEGQLSVFRGFEADQPCYQCLYGEMDEAALTCSEAGVMAPLVGIIGSMQAMETVKVLSGMGQPLTGKLQILDAMTMEWRTMRLRKDPVCKVCSRIT